MTVRQLISRLQECDPEADIWVANPGDDVDDPGDMSVVVGATFIDNDDEESREVGRKRLGVPYLRFPVLRVESNKYKPV